jgi:DNA-binding NarL/FixJ family response regulator
MSPSSVAASDAIGVLVADSNRMQAQLLTSALRRRAEFRVSSCEMEIAPILHAIASAPTRVTLLSPNFSASLTEGMLMLRRFHLAHPEVIKVLMVESDNRELIVSAFRSGVRGIFCIGDANLRILCKCIFRVAAGQIWANTEQMNYLVDLVAEVPFLRLFNAKGHELLTPREEQVVALVADGLSNRLIARELKLSENTVKKYLFRVFDKLGISTRVELVLFAVNHGDPLYAEWLAGARRGDSDSTSLPMVTPSQLNRGSLI